MKKKPHTIGLNHACPSGSGLKYKRCCKKNERSETPGPELPALHSSLSDLIKRQADILEKVLLEEIPGEESAVPIALDWRT